MTLLQDLLPAACSQEEPGGQDDGLPAGEYPLRIGGVTMSVESISGPWTRESENTDRNGSVWDGGEEIGVQIANGTETSIYTLQGDKTTQTSSKPLYWKNTTASKVRAWYPADGNVDLSQQTTEHGPAYALYAETAQAVDYNTPDITLPFGHKLAKVRVVLAGFQADEVTDVKIKTSTSCTLNTDGTLTAGNTEEYIPMVQTIEKCWEANVVPGQEHQITEFQVNGIPDKLTKPVTPEAGKWHEGTITVGKPQTQAQPNADGSYTINEGDYVYITGENIAPITITGTANVELRDVTSTQVEVALKETSSPILITGGTPTITVTGKNTLTLSGGMDVSRLGGIMLQNGAGVVIDGTGSPDIVVDTNHSSGIGAGFGQKCVNITIKNITLTIKIEMPTGYSVSTIGAGVGVCYLGDCDNITIEDATVAVTGAPAIGTAVDASGGDVDNIRCRTIYIANSSVTATGLKVPQIDMYSPAIGAGGTRYSNCICGDSTIINTQKTEAEILSTLTCGGPVDR